MPLSEFYQFNDDRARMHRREVQPAPNGIACPKCGNELYDVNPMVTLASNPPRKDVRCPSCDFASTRVA